MAPFKLKFRMGGSRSTSQEHDPDPQVNEALLNHHSTAIGASSSTIDSADCNSLGSLGTNERKSLLPHKSNTLRLGYLNHNAAHCTTSETVAATTGTVPTTPPPSYEHVLEENTRLANNYDIKQQRQLSTEECKNSQRSRRSSINNSRNSANLSSLERLSLNSGSQCTDPDCQENYANNEQQRLQRQQQAHNGNNEEEEEDDDDDDENECNSVECNEIDDDNRKESIDSTELLIATKMSANATQLQQQQQQQQQQLQQEDQLIENCTGDCQEYDEQYGDGGACGVSCSNAAGSNDFFDPLMNHNGYCNDESHYSDEYREHSQNQVPPEYMERRGDSDSDDGWDTNQMSNSYSHYHEQQQQQQQQQQQYGQQQESSRTPEIISNKSSKEIYKDLAKQWGITCKMSDGCRCMDCQSHYFDCEFDDNEHQKTDGGLGAGTPMFISEVMHGSACNIL